MAILGRGREHDVPSWGENFKKEATKKDQMTWTGALRIVSVLPYRGASIPARTGHQQRSFCPPPKLNCWICTSRSSPEYSVLACMLVYIECAMLADCNQALKAFREGAPAPSPKVKSLAPMHARTKAPVKYHPVRRYMPAMHVHAHQTNYARTSLIRS
ncbi:hypothetical protein M441DRAFT_271686 [Trichoderma asperellum CBS 433.97]|uniref:Uncharacterized protein n=1 Tax=Trichoderma asperellum (strain ATCC 204424 / CBS 433.97 / NBRC 101777) TaxID=1042311 RepID=A0A2T3YWK0_TRIA4|nr:hypothetical protein M441DRAFT_271686 [Trichoderma asperellum CBS 433.97]PTB36904.1 hypothetical protein M441DRAFT_271686 [Trichoderma asperellum CBS 433.97]